MISFLTFTSSYFVLNNRKKINKAINKAIGLFKSLNTEAPAKVNTIATMIPKIAKLDPKLKNVPTILPLAC